MSIRCVLLTPSGQAKASLRRYSHGKCTSKRTYHNAETQLGIVPYSTVSLDDEHSHEDPRWPTHCTCGYEFVEEDVWQYREDQLYAHSNGGNPTTLQDAPVGAMWFAPWLSESPSYKGPDGQTLVVRLPHNHDWIVDSRASNCDSPCSHCGKPYHAHQGGLCNPLPPGTPYDRSQHAYADARPHKCWVRHGEAPNIHVDKNGVTCGAGGGSIQTSTYHGFLHNGELTDC